MMKIKVSKMELKKMYADFKAVYGNGKMPPMDFCDKTKLIRGLINKYSKKSADIVELSFLDTDIYKSIKKDL